MGKLTQADLTKLPGNGIFTAEVPLVAGAFRALGEELPCPCFPEAAKTMLGGSFPGRR